jgi:3-dehydroquinate dehydratase/shikimate dehydrogenase
MTGICISLTESTTAGFIDRMVDLSAQADLFEIRGDGVRDLDLLTLLRAASRPLLFTCRSESEGGRSADRDPARVEALREAVKRGFDLVDVEHASRLLEIVAAKLGRGLVVSHHDLSGVPADLDALYAAMAAGGADIVKIAVTPRSVADVGRLLAFAARVQAQGGTPLVAVAMGPLGVPSRILAGRVGAPFTFASPAEGLEAAPGQVAADVMADLFRVRSIGPGTKVYGIVGRGISYSRSPLIHNRAFAACGVDAVYVPIEAEALAPFLAARAGFGLSGFSVTQPYKVEILPHLDAIDDEAAQAGSVNTVVVDAQGRMRGLSTDGVGVTAPLERHLALEGASVVVLGAGGAARAAAFALRRKGAAVTLLARDPEKAAAAGRALGCAYGALGDAGSARFDVLINATPLGGGSSRGESPWPAAAHRRGSAVLDMVYDPPHTRFLGEAAAAGAAPISGLEMLLAQAVGQFEAWTGMRAPVDVMRTALFGPAGKTS